MAKDLKKAILKAIKEFEKMTPEELKQNRYNKFRALGVWGESD